MRSVLWTLRARADLAAVRAFIEQDSPHVARVVVARIIAATDRLGPFPESGRVVPEVGITDVREVIHAPYRIVYRLVGKIRSTSSRFTTARGNSLGSSKARPNKRLHLTARGFGSAGSCGRRPG